jgi:hypothetical protein
MKRFIIVLVLVVSFVVSFTFKCDAKTPYAPPKESIEELYQDIFVSMLMPKIDKAIHDYYIKDYYYPPMVYPYQVTIEKAERIGEYRSFEFFLTLKTLAVVGPHIEVGWDRMTFYISGAGKVELRKFEHIETFELPKHYKHIERPKRES